MPMLDVQRQHATLYRIRLGDRDGNRPNKLVDRMRITAPSREVVQAFADEFGGTVQPWDNGGKPEFEVYLPTTELPIMVLPGQSVTQWWELYKGQVCDRRCDGQTEVKSGRPCMCPEDRDVRMGTKGACRPMTRLNVVCPTVAVLGAGALVTHGLIAADTLPQSIAIAEAALAQGVMVPAILRVVEHKGRNHFIVPQVEILGASVAQLARGEMPRGAIGAGTGELVGPPRAIESRVEVVGGGGSRRAVPAAASAPDVVVSDGGGAQSPGGPPASDAQVGSVPTPSRVTEPAPESSPASSDSGALPLANQVAMWCRDAGIDTDAKRHQFLAAWSNGKISSSAGVTPADVGSLRAALVDVKRGAKAVVVGEFDVPVLRPTKGAGSRPPKPSDADGPSADGPDWSALTADVPGVGGAKVLRKAREIAANENASVPTALEEIAPEIAEQVIDWLDQLRQEAEAE